jgi:periplasmic glucans biosynthesis protein
MLDGGRAKFLRRVVSIGQVCCIKLLAVLSAAMAEDVSSPFGFAEVEQIARESAEKPFQPPPAQPPKQLEGISYDDYRKIRFRPDSALWRGERLFEVQFFHLGFLYAVPVRINVVQDNQVVQIPFRRDMFNYSEVNLPQDLPSDLGFAGFRLHYPLHTPDYKDEVTVFLGASYFRILGREQRFGASARGLAIDTGLSRGEEFPYFKEFWFVKPGPHETALTLYALLDSHRVSGAYEFRVEPGTETKVDVRGKLFLRDGVEKLGIAPLTSMFFFGENATRHYDDFRPEVHDSDGLLMFTGKGEWIWRPLVNPRHLRVSVFSDEKPRGFGLMQRDREFRSYLDLEADYHHRPSLWVEPLGDWGAGAVELVEIPSDEEINDNVAAFWVPKRSHARGDSLEFSYRLSALTSNDYWPPLGRASSTRIGSANVAGRTRPLPDRVRLFVIDFEGGDLSRLSSQQPVNAEITASAGKVSDIHLIHNDPEDGWRAVFRFDPEDGKPADISLALRMWGKKLTETWTYLWSKDLSAR